jgi:hypothetical protein
MRNRHKKAIIDDVTPVNIAPNLQNNLLDLFEYAMKSVAQTLVTEAKFDINNFASAHEKCCVGFRLALRRVQVSSSTQWLGSFQRGDQRLDVIGHFE